MSTKDNKTPVVSLETLAAAIEAMQSNLNQGQEKTALTMQSLEQRLTRMEGMQPKLDTDARLEAAVDAVKPGIVAGFRQSSTTKKVVIATAATAAVAGLAYSGYKGVEYYRERKTEAAPVEAITLVSPAKSDAIRQGLGVK